MNFIEDDGAPRQAKQADKLMARSHHPHQPLIQGANSKGTEQRALASRVPFTSKNPLSVFVVDLIEPTDRLLVFPLQRRCPMTKGKVDNLVCISFLQKHLHPKKHSIAGRLSG
jgi:hypothetical protein